MEEDLPLFRIGFLLGYGLANLYVYLRLLSLLPPRKGIRIGFSLLLWFCVAALPISRFGLFSPPFFAHRILSLAGGWWLALTFYILFAALLTDLILLATRIAGATLRRRPSFNPGRLRAGRLRRMILIPGLAAAVAVVAAGKINSAVVRTSELDLRVEREGPPPGSLRIVFVSDLHLGMLSPRWLVPEIVERINGLEPDLILLGGDTIDGGGAGGRWDEFREQLAGLRAARGVFAVMGNHEYYSGGEEAADLIRETGIRLLRDEVVEIGERISLAGREDPNAGRLGPGPRKRFPDLIAGVPADNLLIVFEHQPLRDEQLEGLNVDLHLSGHTHHGQLFPLNLITSAIYDTSWGYNRVGDTHVYVSSGAGNTVAPTRTVSRPEIVAINLNIGPGNRRPDTND